MVDLFDEVEGQIRTDRYKAVALQAAPWVSGILVIALVAALGYWGWTVWQQRQMAQASEAYDTALTQLTNGDSTGAFTRFGTLAQSAPSGYRGLALMQQAGIRLSQNQTAEAVAFFDRAASASPHPIQADLASLEAVYALLDTAPLADLQRRITPLMAEGRPFRLQAQEALAMARLLAGQTAAAKTDLEVLNLNLNAPQDMRQRVSTALALIASGRSGAVREAVRAAATLPPPSAANISLPPGMVLPGAAGAQSGTAR